jgi:hypothetical protein
VRAGAGSFVVVGLRLDVGLTGIQQGVTVVVPKKITQHRAFPWLLSTLCPYSSNSCPSNTGEPSDYEPPALTVELHPRLGAG